MFVVAFSVRSDGLPFDPVCDPVDVLGHLGVEPRVDPAALAAGHDAHDVVPGGRVWAPGLDLADEWAARVLLAGVDGAAGAELAGRSHVALVEVVAVVLRNFAHSNSVRPQNEMCVFFLNV